MSSTSAIKAGGAEIEIGARDKTSTVFNALRGRMAAIGTYATMAGGAVNKSFAGIGSAISIIANGSNKAALGILSIGAVIAGIGAASVMTLNTVGDKFDKMAMRTGESTEKLSQLAFVADQSGTSIEALESAMNKSSKFMMQLAGGSKAAKADLAKLGLTMEDLEGKSPTDMVLTLGEALGKMPDVVERNALTLKLLGKSANELQPLFLSGADGIREMMAEADALGGTVTRSQADIGAGLNDAFGRLSTATSGVFRKIGEKIGPIVIDMVNKAAFLFAEIGPAIASIAHRIVAIMSAVGRVFGPIFSSAKDAVLGSMSEMVDGIPALAFNMYRIYQTTVAKISELFMKMVAGVQTAFEQLMTGELLIKLQGTVADLIIDLREATGLISEAEAREIRQNRREDTQALLMKDPAIVESRNRQKKIADDLANSLEILGGDLDKKLKEINQTEKDFNKAKDEALAMNFALPDMGNLFGGLDLAGEVTAAVKQAAPTALERGSLEAFKQGEENKRMMNPVVNAVKGVEDAVNEFAGMMDEKLNFEPVG